MKHVYNRVSTGDRNPALHLAALKKAGCETVFRGKVAGAHANRPSLAHCLRALDAVDGLIMWKRGRPGRNLSGLIRVLDSFNERDIAFRSLTEAIDSEARPNETPA